MRSSVKNKIIWTIALPIIFGNLAQTLIALTDTAFLGRVSAVALGASMMAGIFHNSGKLLLVPYTKDFGIITRF